jgi:pimeloyl-ACP methyl ester carboxylesterase
MTPPGHDASHVLPDGRIIEYWEGGDPDGKGVIFHPGTPVSHVMGRWAHDDAVAAGVRLVSLSRPGYGNSTTLRSASLMRVGRDTAALASHLGFDGYAVVGSSGGGPFAVATAVADPSGVRALGVVGGMGPWRVLEGPSVLPEDRECLALLDAGDLDGAWEIFRGQYEEEFGSIDAPDDAVELIMAGEVSSVIHDESYRALWADNMRVVLSNFDGGVMDNLAWGGTWDVDLRDVAVPSLLWFGEDDDHCPPSYGRWYADRIADSQLIIIPGGGHFDIIDAHWPEVLAGLLRIQRATDS